MLTDRGTEYCGAPDRHEYELCLAVEDIDHTQTKMRSPQTNGICERFRKTLLNVFYRVAFRKKIHRWLEELQSGLGSVAHRVQMSTARIKAAGAMGKHRCKRFWTPCRSRRRS